MHFSINQMGMAMQPSLTSAHRLLSQHQHPQRHPRIRRSRAMPSHTRWLMQPVPPGILAGLSSGWRTWSSSCTTCLWAMAMAMVAMMDRMKGAALLAAMRHKDCRLQCCEFLDAGMKRCVKGSKGGQRG